MAAVRPPYAVTAVRPSWDELPDAVRAAITARTGTPTEVTVAGGGFTAGFAASVTDVDGRRTFVKAVSSSNQPIHASYVREAEVHALLPLGVPAPRLTWRTDVDVEDGTSWVLLGFDQVEGRMPGQPWTADDFGRVVLALEATADALRSLEWDAPDRLADDAGDAEVLTFWQRVDVTHLDDDLATWVVEQRARLSAATGRAPAAFIGDDWIHTDVRADNLLLDEEQVWLVDWNWLTRAPAWVDLALLLPQAFADAVDLAPALRSRLLAGVPDDDVDAVIAWLAAFVLVRAEGPEPTFGSPWIRHHQRWTAETSLRLLRARWGS
jgi:hypothetical protein